MPEVVSGKSIWHDTREYFAPDVEITTTVVCNRVFTRGGSTFVNVHGHVEVQGKAVLATEGFTYILVPTDKHPATRKPLE